MLHCLPHKLLINKLDAYGVSESVLKLIKNDFSNRKQCVTIGNIMSEWEDIYKGSIWDTVFFKIFINDIFYFIQESSLYNYADDNTLSYEGYKSGPINHSTCRNWKSEKIVVSCVSCKKT